MTPGTQCTLTCVPSRSTEPSAFQGPSQPRAKNLKPYNTLCVYVHVRKTVRPRLGTEMSGVGTMTAFIPGKLLAYSKNGYVEQKQKSRDTNKVLPLIAFLSNAYV